MATWLEITLNRMQNRGIVSMIASLTIFVFHEEADAKDLIHHNRVRMYSITLARVRTYSIIVARLAMPGAGPTVFGRQALTSLIIPSPSLQQIPSTARTSSR